ncbi:protein ripply2 isoform X1 [Paroedura picta]|uniref:protein ripply2 isoform X1 n=1 Tax=Paroedura picta TaxID=143630 RepID=UPI0040564E5A
MESSQLCHCGSPRVEALSGRIGCKSQLSSESFWRPWIATPKDAERERGQNHSALCSLPEITENSAKLTQYTHPVRDSKQHISASFPLFYLHSNPLRLFWPKSKCFDYLYQEAEALLRNFPVQATISFYEDSESEEEDEELENHS